MQEGNYSKVEGESQTCPRPSGDLHQLARPSRHKPVSLLQTSTQELLDFSPSRSAPFLARGNQLSASSLDFVKPPVAPIFPLFLVPALKHDCRVAVTPTLSPAAFPKRMLRTCGGIGRAHTPLRMPRCCRGVCELPILRLRPGFDPLALEFLPTAGFLCGWIQVCSTFGYNIDPSLEGICFDPNRWRTYQPVLTPCRPSTCLKGENM